jgi:hypothetical protein
MPALPVSVNELVARPNGIARTTTMLDLIDLPSCPLRHGLVNNTHKTHTAIILVASPGRALGFLNLKCGFDSRRGHITRRERPERPHNRPSRSAPQKKRVVFPEIRKHFIDLALHKLWNRTEAQNRRSLSRCSFFGIICGAPGRNVSRPR